MPDDFELIELRDDFRILRDNSVVQEKVARFYLGKFGPFTERFDAAGFTGAALQTRVQALRATLAGMPR